MPSTYTPNPTNNPASITIPSDGDDAIAASADGAFKDLADRSAHSQQPATDNTVRYPLATRTSARWTSNPPVSKSRSAVLDWELIETSGLVAMAQVNITDADSAVIFYLDLPDQAEVNDVQVQVTGTGGHGAFPIAGFHLPVLSFVEFDPVTQFTNVVGATTDPSATAAAYQASHAIEITGLTTTVDRGNKIYYLVLYGEYGTGAIAGLAAWGGWAQKSISNMDPDK
jgi:hypothetical protein